MACQLRLHPALPAYLAAAWRAEAGAGYADERAAAESAMVQAGAAFGRWLNEQIAGGEAGGAFNLLDDQRRTLGRLLGQALEAGRFDEAQMLLQPLDAFWDARGLRAEARVWADRCVAAVEARDGASPDLESAAGQLWLFARGTEANRAILARDLDSAHAVYDGIRQRLEAASGPSRDRQLATTYHQIGMIAQQRGDLDGAETWYGKSLAIKETLGDRSGVASSYHQLGIVAQLRGDLDGAEAWYGESLAIREALGDRPSLASNYHMLGIVAQARDDVDAAEAWYGKSLAIKEALGDRPGLASTYHMIGTVAQARGDLAGAEGWYGKSLAIKEALGNRPGLATSYHQLGIVAQLRGDLDAAEAWYGKSLAILEALGDRSSLASSYHQLGILAQERGDLDAAEAWFRKERQARGQEP